MLILERRAGESIVIGDGIVITVVSVRAWDRRCQLGIEAPPAVVILRGELVGKTLEERRNEDTA